MKSRIEPFERVTWYGCALLMVWALTLIGCANPEKSYRVAYATTAQSVAGAWKALDAYDQGHVADILAMPHDSATVELARYEKQLVVARKVLATATDALDVANHGGKLYQLIAAKDWAHALSELLQIGMTVRDALSVFGVEVF